MGETKDDLDKLRASIRAKDDAILKLVAERIQLAKEIGKVKLAHNLPIKDFQVEKDVINRARQKAREIGLYEQLAADQAKLLIQYAVMAQDEFHSRAMTRGDRDHHKILVVGGRGLMGRWLSDFFDSFGHQVTLFDQAKVDRAGGEDRYPQKSDLAEAIAGQDFIVLATPISVTAQIIEALVKLQTKATIFDIASLKSPLIPAIEQAEKAGLAITSIHPMFGPDVELLAGRNIIFCDCQNPALTNKALALFEKTTANLLRMPLSQHDEVIGYILGFSHLHNLVFGQVLTQSGIAFTKLAEAGSTTFNAQLGVTAPVVNENQDLYFEIQAENTFTPQLIAGIRKALDQFDQSICEKDRDGFRKLMQQAKDYLEPEA